MQIHNVSDSIGFKAAEDNQVAVSIDFTIDRTPSIETRRWEATANKEGLEVITEVYGIMEVDNNGVVVRIGGKEVRIRIREAGYCVATKKWEPAKLVFSGEVQSRKLPKGAPKAEVKTASKAKMVASI